MDFIDMEKLDCHNDGVWRKFQMKKLQEMI